MKILLLGKNGQVGFELQRALAPLGQVIACDREEADLEQPAALRALVEGLQPDVIVNAAAYTAVDRAETEPDRAFAINAEAVATLAAAARAVNAWLVHYSTDYVFDGTKADAYVETDAPNPASVYGQSKWAGEQAISNSGCRHLIFRTSWVYGTHGNNFAKTMLRLAAERPELRVVADQIGAPTAAELIADVTALCLYRLSHDAALANRASGTYHLVAGGETSWNGFARAIVRQALTHGVRLQAQPASVLEITTSEYPLPAPRPQNSRMNNDKLQATFAVNLPDWQLSLPRIIAQLAR